MSRFSRIGWCSWVLGWAVGMAAAAPTPPEWVRWFSDDFEDGTARRWRIWSLDGRDTNANPMAWRVEQDGGNKVFADRQEFFARPKTVRGADYRVKARVKVIRGFLNVALRHDCVCYFVNLNAGGLSLSRTRPCGVHTTLNSVRSAYDPGRWYDLEMVAIGPDIRVYVDNELKISYSDPEPVPFGGVMFWSAGDSYVQVDDVEVTGPPQVATSLQVADVLLPTAVVGLPYTHTLTARGGAAPYRWSMPEGLKPPQGLTLSEDGTISGALAQKDSYTLLVQVTDADGNRATEGLRLGTEQAVITTGAALPAGEVGVPYSHKFELAGMPGGCQWAAPELPPAMMLNPASGVLSGTPTLGGTYRILVACLSATSTLAKIFGFYAVEASPRPLAIATRPEDLLDLELTGGVEGSQIAATGGTPPYSWAVTAGELPPGTRLLSGQLLADQVSPLRSMVAGYPKSVGQYRFTIEATDNAGNKAARELDLQTTWMNVGGDANYDDVMILTMGEPFSSQLAATGGIAPYRWQAVSLPAGLNLSSEGRLSGVPAECGMFPAVALVTDSDSPPVAHRFGGDFNFVISCAKGSFSWVSINSPAEITGAKLNEPFEYPIGLGNGSGSGYRCTLSDGALPRGLTLSEGKLPGVMVISGTPAETGTFGFELRATDDRGNLGVRKLKLVVE